jgi:predicted PurR-regulated permease PerM
MLMSGIIGLFLGAVILALGYKLFQAWMGEGEPAAEAETAESGA